MKTLVVSCKTLQLEVEKALRETGRDYPVLWIESGLHNFPDRLRANLQKVLDQVCAKRVLLAMGFCGNSVAGLVARDYELIIPRADDCITLLLGSSEERKRYERTYFLTKGWLDGERNIYEEYKYTLRKYGKEQGKDIIRMMLGHYQYMGLLDTGVYDFNTLIAQVGAIADELGLTLKIIPSTVKRLEGLLTGPWSEEDFCIIAPNTEVSSCKLTL